MLNCYVLKSPEQKFSIIKEFNFDDYLVVTGNLESKFGWQAYMLDKLQGLVAGERVLRASELWQQILNHHDGQWRILPSDYLTFIIESWIGEAGEKLGLGILPRDRQMALATLTQLLPLVSHGHGHDAIKEWFAEKPEAAERWQDWYILSQYLWQMMKQEKVLPENLIPGYLINQDIEWISDKKLLLDIGLDMNSVEGELIVNLSRRMDIEVLIPEQFKEDPLSAYHELAGKALEVTEAPELERQTPQFAKFPSMLSEVKQSLQLVRQWLDEGLQPQDIVITSPVIENYWPTLSEYMLVEGVPVNKPIVAPLSQRIEIQRWLSAIRLSLKQATPLHLQQNYFLGESEFSYRKFKQNFSNYFGEEDLARDPKVAESQPQAMAADQPMLMRDFLSEALALWPRKDLEQISLWIGHFDSVWYDHFELTADKWLEFFEFFFARREYKIRPGDERGLRIGSLEAVENYNCQKIIVLGLSQDNLKSTSQTPISLSDIMSIQNTHGFYLDHAERGLKEKQLAWICNKSASEVVALVAETDFAGRFQTPSLFWLQGASDTEVQAPGHSRWDYLMMMNEGAIIWDNQELTEQSQAKLKSDRLREAKINLDLGSVRMSASTLEKYFACPFKVLAQKGFRLSDDPPLDLDPDAGSRGSMLHKICELVLASGELKTDKEFIENIVNKAKEECGLTTVAEEFWPYSSRFFHALARNFINNEIKLRAEFPQAKTLDLEARVEGYMTLQAEQLFSRESAGESWPFLGKIDRIDQNDQGEVVLVDYKSSENNLSQYGSWLQKGQLQLLIYALALQDGLGPNAAENVVGAYYYVLKDFTRKYGINDSEINDFYPVKKNKVSFAQLVVDAKKQLREMLGRIREGDFSAQPLEKDVCKKCEWDKICRRSQAL